MSIDQENVFNDQQNDNGVFAADDNDRPASTKKEPSKAKNTKLLIYSMLGLFIVAVCGVGAIAFTKYTKSGKSRDNMAIQSTKPLPTNADMIEPAKPVVNVPPKTVEPIKKEALQITSPSMPNAVVDINSIPVEKREPEVNRDEFYLLQQRVSKLEGLLTQQLDKTSKLELQLNNMPATNGKSVTNTLAKRTDTYISKKRVVKHKKEAVVDDSVLFEPSPSSTQVVKTKPIPPAPEPVGRMHGEYKLKAIVEDRVWLEDPQGNSITVTQGDPVSGLGNLTAVDEHDFKVRFSTGATLKGQ
jgi:hypothetical protein